MTFERTKRDGVNLGKYRISPIIRSFLVSGPMKIGLKIVNIQWKGKFKLIVDLSPVSPVSVPDSKFSARPQFLVRGYKLSSPEKDVLQRKAKSFFLIVKWTGPGQIHGQSNLFYGQLLSLYYFPSVQSLRSVRRNFIWRFWYFAVSFPVNYLVIFPIAIDQNEVY